MYSDYEYSERSVQLSRVKGCSGRGRWLPWAEEALVGWDL